MDFGRILKAGDRVVRVTKEAVTSAARDLRGSNSPSFAEAKAEYLAFKRPKWKATTITCNESWGKTLELELGGLPVGSITTERMKSVLDPYRNRPGQFNRLRSFSRCVHNRCVDLGQVDGPAPVDAIDPMPVPKREGYFRLDQLQHLLTLCEELEAAGRIDLCASYAVRIAAETAMRKTEVLSLRWDQLQVQQGRVVFQLLDEKKLRKVRRPEIVPRAVPLSPSTVRLVHQYRSELDRRRYRLWGIDVYRSLQLFPARTDRGGQYATKKPHRQTLYGPWDQLLGEMGIDKGTENKVFHLLRHTFATLGLESGIPEHELAAAMGLSLKVFRNTYCKLTQNSARAGADKFADVLARRLPSSPLHSVDR